MSWLPRGSVFHCPFGCHIGSHYGRSICSMVLLQIDMPRVSVAPFERDAPRTVDMKAVALRRAPEWMKIEAGNVEITQGRSPFQRIQPPKRSALEVRRHSSALTSTKQVLEPLVTEAPYHRRKCNISIYTCKPLGYKRPNPKTLVARGTYRPRVAVGIDRRGIRVDAERNRTIRTRTIRTRAVRTYRIARDSVGADVDAVRRGRAVWSSVRDAIGTSVRIHPRTGSSRRGCRDSSHRARPRSAAPTPPPAASRSTTRRTDCPR